MEAKDIEDRINAMENQVKLSDSDYRQLEKWITEEDAYIRDLVASMLVHFPTSDSKNLLLRLAKDPDELVRADAYDSLCEFPYPDSLDVLLDAITSEPDAVARFCAIRSCAEVMLLLKDIGENNQAILVQICDHDPSDLCKLAGYYGRYLLGNPELLDLIVAFLSHPDYHIRCSAISVLSDIMDDNNASYLKSLILRQKEIEDSEAVISCIDSFLSM